MPPTESEEVSSSPMKMNATKEKAEKFCAPTLRRYDPVWNRSSPVSCNTPDDSLADPKKVPGRLSLCEKSNTRLFATPAACDDRATHSSLVSLTYVVAASSRPNLHWIGCCGKLTKPVPLTVTTVPPSAAPTFGLREVTVWRW